MEDKEIGEYMNKSNDIISSTDNERIKEVSKLNKTCKFRKKQGCFVVEGARIYKEIPKELLMQTYVTQTFYENNRMLFEGVKVQLVSENVFGYISDTKTPQGVLAVVKMLSACKDAKVDTKGNKKPTILVLENIQDPGNLGTIIRMAEGADVDRIYMSKDTVDVYNPKVIRSTMGSIFRVPFSYEEDILATVVSLKNQGICTYAAHLEGKSLYEYSYNEGCAFLIGNEGNGLTNDITQLADKLIRIPMEGRVESLNAAMAATIIAYEVFRQKSN